MESFLGIGDVSEETHALRNKLSSKGTLPILPAFSNVAHKPVEGQIAAQQDKLARQATEIQELNNALNEAFHKVWYFLLVEVNIRLTTT